MDAERRSALRRIGLVVGVGTFAAPLVVSKVHPASLGSERFDSIASAIRTIESLKTADTRMTGAWDLAHMLHHTSQSVEYSMTGFPAPKPAWFRSTLGSYAFALFNARGQMTHSLSEPIPGAPDIPQGQALGPAINRVIAVLHAFDGHTGALAPHFAYGRLSKADYTRAHLMHFANHWNELIT